MAVCYTLSCGAASWHRPLPMNYSGKQTGQAADYVEHKEFRIFLEMLVFILQGEDNHKPVLGMENLRGDGQSSTTTCCGGCVIS